MTPVAEVRPLRLRQPAQNGLQDATVAVVVHVHRRIQPGDGRELHHRTVLALRPHLHRLAGLERPGQHPALRLLGRGHRRLRRRHHDRQARLRDDAGRDADAAGVRRLGRKGWVDDPVVRAPPLLPVHDARSLGLIADLSLFITRQDRTTLTEVLEGIEVFLKSGNKISGLIYNGFVPSGLRYGYAYRYSYLKYGRYQRNKKYTSHYGSYEDRHVE